MRGNSTLQDPEGIRERALDALARVGIPRMLTEYVSIGPYDAAVLGSELRALDPANILEVGTFVGVSSAVIALSAPRAHICCVDPDFPIGAQASLSSRPFSLEEPRSSFQVAGALMESLGFRTRATLYSGFFSCLPDDGARSSLERAGVRLDGRRVVGEEICTRLGPFDAVFLDGDHREAAVLSDLRLSLRHVALDGVVFVHDIGEGPWHASVQNATRQVLREHPEVTLRIEGNVGILLIQGSARR